MQVAATIDTGVAVWDLDPHHWLGAACAIAGRNLTRAEWNRYLGALRPYHRTCRAFAT
jgi:hypothetical protein